MAQTRPALVEAQDAIFFVRGREAYLQLEQEAVELRLRQTIRPLVFNRILRRHDGEHIGKRMADAVDGDGLFLHDLEQGRLRLGRRAVDLVGHKNIGENRPGAKLKPARPQVKHVRAQDVRRHQVRGELDALAVDPQEAGDGPRHQRFGGARHPFEQDVAAANKGQQHELDVLALPDDHALRALQQIFDQFRNRPLLLSLHASPLDVGQAF